MSHVSSTHEVHRAVESVPYAGRPAEGGGCRTIQAEYGAGALSVSSIMIRHIYHKNKDVEDVWVVIS